MTSFFFVEEQGKYAKPANLEVVCPEVCQNCKKNAETYIAILYTLKTLLRGKKNV